MHTHGLTKRTAAQREDTIISLSKKPIKEIWAKQASVKAQQTHMFDLYVKAKKTHNYNEVDKLYKQSEELSEMEFDLKEAIRRK